MNSLYLSEHRCNCGKLLLKGLFFDGTLEIKCKKCGEINKIGSIKLADDNYHYILVLDSKGNIINFSESALEMLGYSYEELLGKNVKEINPTISKETDDKLFCDNPILNEFNYNRRDTIHRTKNGDNFPVSVFFKLHKVNSETKDYSVLAIVEVLKPESESNSSYKMKDFADCDFYFDIDANGVGEYMSPSVEKIFGFTPGFCTGKNYFDLVPPEIREKSKKVFETFSAKKLPYRLQYNFMYDINGKMIKDELYFTPNFNDNGKFIGYHVLGWIKN